ncbi:B3 domain-containing protein At4g01580-like [Lycium barbarum]|uniref:B3 domain-containing protein At4g01580-like n=1 Tax=Lycium barbarum TaxID=112863 RepID=UPI00293E4932|nr:B3 domain-containing protein At4g01580-like [Lycium barbarum]
MGLVASSSSLVHPPRPRPQMLMGGNRNQRGTPSPSESQHHIHAFAERTDPESSPDTTPDVVSLEVPSGEKWGVKLQNSDCVTWLKKGWNQFREYYSIGFGYFLLFKYNGNSHFSVLIFDLIASEIEYSSIPNEDMTLENVVNIVGDGSHKKKACRSETQNNS